jgi:hypothetical protein
VDVHIAVDNTGKAHANVKGHLGLQNMCPLKMAGAKVIHITGVLIP